MSISVRNLTKKYGDFVALDEVSVNVPEGSLTAILGPSGCGKSTLLRSIAGLEHPDGGEIEIAGREVASLPAQRREVGFVFQHYAPFKTMTVRENIAFGLKVRKRPKAEIKQRVDELVALVQLEGWADRYPSQLSGGQRQRMALARALAPEPSVLLLDEPFGALDAQVRQDLRVWLRDLHERVTVTTIFVTHDQEEAMEVADEIVVMNHGVVEQTGTPRDIYEHPINAFVMEFVGPVTKLDGESVRPHDLNILLEPVDGATPGTIHRVLHLGFEVRVEVTLNNGEDLWIQVPYSKAGELDLEAGQEVFLRPRNDVELLPGS